MKSRIVQANEKPGIAWNQNIAGIYSEMRSSETNSFINHAITALAEIIHTSYNSLEITSKLQN